jgi:hypothetical protein
MARMREQMPRMRPQGQETQRYMQVVGQGGWSIKLMTATLMAATVAFGYSLHLKQRLPWQYGLGAEYVKSRR